MRFFTIALLVLTIQLPLLAATKNTFTELSDIVRNATEANIVSFDLDETLISSANLSNDDIARAKELGYEEHTAKSGMTYFIRPGAFVVLDKAKKLGFDLIIITHNDRAYAKDILESSGLARYFDKVIAQEHMHLPENTDFDSYPCHRNRTYPQRSRLKLYTTSLYKSYFVRGFKNLTGHKNIRPYIARPNTSKYPPMYGARVHFDNSSFNVKDSKDFVGLEVSDFYATELEPKTLEGELLWVQQSIAALKYLKDHGWMKLYEHEFGHAPDLECK